MFPANCYKKVEQETKEIQAKIQEKLGSNPIDKDVIVLYDGETVPEQVCEDIYISWVAFKAFSSNLMA